LDSDGAPPLRRMTGFVRQLHRRGLFPVLAFVLPTNCFVCARRLGPFQRLGACLSCWGHLRPMRGPRCSGCGLSTDGGTDLIGPVRGRCARCRLRPPRADAVRSALIYDALAKRFLLRAKFGRRGELFVPLGEQLAADLRLSGFHLGCSRIVPVPSHPWHDFRRGFGPAFELALTVARRLAIPLEKRRLVHRLGGIIQLKRLSAHRRREAVAGRYRARGAVNGCILLIDDVMTTGATAEACVDALKEAGADEVRVAVWARTPIRAGIV
jgi:predicted amidophosphoribosyltransferase